MMGEENNVNEKNDNRLVKIAISKLHVDLCILEEDLTNGINNNTIKVDEITELLIKISNLRNTIKLITEEGYF